MQVWIVSEGSGGHLIPALEVSRALASTGSMVRLFYVERSKAGSLLQGLLRDAREDGVRLHSLQVPSCRMHTIRSFWRLGQAAGVWTMARRLLREERPDVVVGFGGWVSVPVIMAAKQARVPVLLHEQNVRFGRATRFLQRWADRVAVSFPPVETSSSRGRPRAWRKHMIITGLPVRPTIGLANRISAARVFGLNPEAWTVLVLGGSQGSRALNQLIGEMASELSAEERRTWQFIHLCGAQDYPAVKDAYASWPLRGWVAPHLADMAVAYASADVVIARAGASTLAELASCGLPAILIPYPLAAGHQRDNAKAAESIGAAMVLEEREATPARIYSTLRRLFVDERLRHMMGEQMRLLARSDATQRVVRAIEDLAVPPRADRLATRLLTTPAAAAHTAQAEWIRVR